MITALEANLLIIEQKIKNACLKEEKYINVYGPFSYEIIKKLEDNNFKVTDYNHHLVIEW